jgi:hypothetical protein
MRSCPRTRAYVAGRTAEGKTAREIRRCRQAGITPRGLVDCMIVAVAWRHQAMLLASDADLHHVARIIGIGLDESSRPDQR